MQANSAPKKTGEIVEKNLMRRETPGKKGIVRESTLEF